MRTILWNNQFLFGVGEVIKSKAMLQVELPYRFRRSFDRNLMCVKFTQKAQKVRVKK